MSFDLCTEKKAEHPFFIESIGVRIYTIEELCWFLHNNLYLIDRSVTSAALAAWIRDELGMKTLARKLMDAVERPDRDASYFIVPIFQEIGYLSPEEMRRLREELTRVQIQPEDQRAKIRADYLVSGGRSAAAITAYRKILDKKAEGNLGTSFYASVWNNLGCAYAQQFRFRDAADAFLTGWKLVQTRELMRKYVSTLPLFLSEEEYREKLTSLGADGMLIGKIQEYNASVAREAEEKIASRLNPAEDPAREMEQLKAEYRRGAFH